MMMSDSTKPLMMVPQIELSGFMVYLFGYRWCMAVSLKTLLMVFVHIPSFNRTTTRKSPNSRE